MGKLEELLLEVDECRDEILSLERSLVQIPSVNTGFMPTGNETVVCQFIQDWLAKQKIDSLILEAAPGRGNLLAELVGQSGKPGLLFMSHLDVVPVEDASKWKFPPFSATVFENRVYGRGSADCKGLLTAQLMAMSILHRNHVALRDNLVLASGADEEHGGRYGFEWLVDHYPERLSAPIAVNEGGGHTVKSGDGFVYLLGVGEKGRLQVEIDIKGSSAHASTPWQGTNSLYGLGRMLQRIEDYEAERDTSTTIFQYLSNFAIEHVPSVQNIDEIIADIEPNNPQLSSILKGLSRMTLTPTIVAGGIKSNSVPENIRLTCDVRTLPNQDDEYLKQELDKIFEGLPGVSYEIDYMAVPNSSSAQTEFAEQIKEVTAQVLGLSQIDLVPAISTGFTDSRFLRPLGVTTYGFTGSHPGDDPMLSHIHGTDESIGIKSLVNSTKIMLALACRVLGER